MCADTLGHACVDVQCKMSYGQSVYFLRIHSLLIPWLLLVIPACPCFTLHSWKAYVLKVVVSHARTQCLCRCVA